MHPIPRDYQLADVEDLRHAIRSGHRSLLYVCPTGGGKTVTACHIIRGAMEKRKKIKFVAHRRELVLQCSARLDDLEIPHGIIMGNHRRVRPYEDIHVCSIQTLARRNSELDASPDIIFIDEAHRAMARSYRTVLEMYPNAVCVGLTATPVRGDGKGLGDLFTYMTQSLGVQDLTEMGYLVPARVFAPDLPDLRGIAMRGYDYDSDAAEQVMMERRIIGNTVEHWLRYGRGRPTTLFATTVKHSRSLIERFQAAGVRCRHLDGETPNRERDATLSDLRAGRIELISNCAVLTEGWDCPPVSCVILVRPTTSTGLYLQMAGRALRPFPGKQDCLIFDHAGCAYRHGLPSDERQWSLERGEARKSKKKKKQEPGVRICQKCYFAFSTRAAHCPNCGNGVKVPGFREEDGELVEVKIVKREHPILGILKTVQRERGYKPGWIWITWQNLKRLKPQARQEALEAIQCPRVRS